MLLKLVISLTYIWFVLKDYWYRLYIGTRTYYICTEFVFSYPKVSGSFSLCRKSFYLCFTTSLHVAKIQKNQYQRQSLLLKNTKCIKNNHSTDERCFSTIVFHCHFPLYLPKSIPSSDWWLPEEGMFSHWDNCMFPYSHSMVEGGFEEMS